VRRFKGIVFNLREYAQGASFTDPKGAYKSNRYSGINAQAPLLSSASSSRRTPVVLLDSVDSVGDVNEEDTDVDVDVDLCPVSAPPTTKQHKSTDEEDATVSTKG
jgi:hypothetical protein